MTESKEIFLDTNILIYQTFKDFDEDKHEKVSEILNQLKAEGYTFYISSQVIREYFSISTNNKFFETPLDINDALLKINEFRNHFYVLFGSDLSINELIYLVSKYQVRRKNIHDANIVATMTANRLSRLLTCNAKDFKQYEEIELYPL